MPSGATEEQIVSLRLALYQPDIPQNAGAAMRLAACLAAPLEILEPCGFLWSDKALKRVGLDYRDLAAVRRFDSWDAWLAQREAGRIVLLTARARSSHVDFAFRADDTLLLGRESSGAPPEVHARADARIRVPIAPGTRSLNLVVAAAMVLGEAMRQTGSFPAALDKVAS